MATAAGAAPLVSDGIILSNTTMLQTRKALNLKLLKLGPMVATILGGIFTAITLASAAAIVVIIAVASTPLPPSPFPDFASTYKQVEVPIWVLQNDKDERVNVLTITKVSPSEHGATLRVVPQVGNIPAHIRYKSKQYFSGNDTFTYTVSNGPQQASAVVTVGVFNTVPEAVDMEYQTLKNVPFYKDIFEYVTAAGAKIKDADNDTLSIVSVQKPANGTVAFNQHMLSYIPHKDFVGEDKFTYTIADNDAATATATLTFTVVNLAPVANMDSYVLSKAQVTVLNITSNDYDPNGDNVQLVGVFNEAFGTATINEDGKTVTFRSDPQTYYDSFQYTVSDGDLRSSSFVSISYVNAPPTTQTVTVKVPKNGDYLSFSVPMEDRDPLDVLTFSLNPEQSPQYGSIMVNVTQETQEVVYGTYWVRQKSINVYTLQYKPKLGFLGSDSIGYLIDDNEKQFNSVVNGMIQIQVINTAPVAMNDTSVCHKNLPCDIFVTENDVDSNGDPIRVALQQPFATPKSQMQGSLSVINATHVRYNPANQFKGEDTFEYQCQDEQPVEYASYVKTSENYATVTVTVVNDNPIAVDDLNYLVVKGNSIEMDVLANDKDPNGDSLVIESVEISTSNIMPQIVIINGKSMIRYTADTRKYSDSFRYRIKDVDNATSQYATVVVTVQNTPPVALPDIYTVVWNTGITIFNVLANDTDVDVGDNANFRIVTPAGSTPEGLVNRGTEFAFSPNHNFVGVLQFTYTMTDGIDVSNSASLTVHVINHAPIARAISNSTHFSSPIVLDVLSVCSDVDGDALTISQVTTPSKGSASIITVNGKQMIQYIPSSSPYSTGIVTFSYNVTDGNMISSGIISLSLTNSNPIAQNDAYTIHWRQSASIPLTILDNDSDSNPQDIPLQVNPPVKIGTYADGALTVDNVNHYISYSAPTVFPQGWNRINTFTYTVTDGVAVTSATTVTVTHTNTDKPVNMQDTRQIHWRQQVSGITLNGLTSVTDSNGDTLRLSLSPQGVVAPAVVTISSGNGIQTVSYSRTPARVNVADTFTIGITDGLDTAVYSYSVTAVNRAPLAPTITVSMPYAKRDTGITINLNPTDPDPEDAMFVSVTYNKGLSGSVVSLMNNVLSYSYPGGFTGSDLLSYTVSDGLASTVGQINITMTPPDNSSASYEYHWTQASAGVTMNILDDVTTYVSDEATIVSTVPPTKGTIQDIEGRSILYTWNSSIANLGNDIFSVFYDDGVSSSGTISVQINIKNIKPVCGSFIASNVWNVFLTYQNISFMSAVTGSEVQDTISAVFISAQPLYGTAQLSGNNVLYERKNPGLISDNLAIDVSDGLETCTVNIQVRFTNNPPSIGAKTFSAHWRSALPTATNPVFTFDITQNDSDADGNSLSTPVQPSNANINTYGQVTRISGNSFRFTASQTILATNVRKSSVFNYILSDTVSNVTNSFIVVINNAVPVAVNDGSTGSRLNVPATSRISGGHLINVMANDIEDDIEDRSFLSISLPSSTSAGGASLAVVSNQIRYTPPINTLTSKQDQFTYVLTDQLETSTQATVFVDVVNTAPTASNATLMMPWNSSPQSVNLVQRCSDIDSGDALTYAVNPPVSYKGSLSGSNGFYSYTPIPNRVVDSEYGSGHIVTDTIPFTCTDLAGNTVGQTIQIQLVNHAPVCSRTVERTENMNRNGAGTVYTFNILALGSCTDADSDTMTVVSQTYDSAIPAASRKGSVTLSNNVISYTVQTPFVGTETWAFTLSDGQRSITKSISITFTNSAPTCTSPINLGNLIRTGVTYNNLLTLMNAQDINQDTLSLSVASSDSTFGTITVNSVSNIVFRGASKIGATSATFALRDGALTTNCIVNWTYMNRNPSANNINKNVPRKTTAVSYTWNLMIDGSVTDIDSDSVSITSAVMRGSTCSGSTLTGNSTVIFTPPANTEFNVGNPCLIDYTVNDGFNSIVATITVLVTDTPPVAVDDYFEFDQGATSYNILFTKLAQNDLDENGDSVTVVGGQITNCDGCTIGVDSVSIPFNPRYCNSFKFNYRATSNGINSNNFGTVTAKPINCICKAPLDVVFVIEGSANMGSTNFGKIKTFINGVISKLTISSTLQRVSVVQFSDTADYKPPQGYNFQIASTAATYITGQLNPMLKNIATREGLRYAYNYWKSARRVNVPATFVLITSGNWNRPCIGSNAASPTTTLQCQDVLDYEMNYDGTYNYCKNNPSASGCSNAYAMQTVPLYANRTNALCTQCSVNNNCFPCADPVPIATQIKADQAKIVALGVGNSISASSQQSIAMMSSSGVFESVPWDNLQSATSKIVDNSCDISCGGLTCSGNTLCCSNVYLNGTSTSRCYDIDTQNCTVDEQDNRNNTICNSGECGCGNVCYDTRVYYCDAVLGIQPKGAAMNVAIKISADNSYKLWITPDCTTNPSLSSSFANWMSPPLINTSVKRGDMIVIQVQNDGIGSAGNPGALAAEVIFTSVSRPKIVTDASWTCISGPAPLPVCKCATLNWPKAVVNAVYKDPTAVWTQVKADVGFDMTSPLPKWLWVTNYYDQAAAALPNEIMTCMKIIT